MEEILQKLLILDLDETLIHASENKLAVSEDFKFDKYFIYKRPQLDQFLIDISRHFKIGIWSSAGDIYVAEIAKIIKPVSVDFEIVWGRKMCTLKKDYTFDKNYFEKKLSKLKKKGFQLEQIIIVDDSAEKSRSNYGTAVYIKEFRGDRSDEELKHLHPYLLSLKDVENIRAVEKRGWRLTHNMD